MTNDKRQPANFLSGLILGLALGSTLAYFSTPEGKKTWSKLSKNWEQARSWLYEQNLIDNPNLSLDEFKNNFLLNMKQSILGAKDGLELLVLNLERSKTKKRNRKRILRRKKKAKFKGV